MILKAPPSTPSASAWLAARRGLRGGRPPGVVNVVPGFGEDEALRVRASTIVDKDAFTGLHRGFPRRSSTQPAQPRRRSPPARRWQEPQHRVRRRRFRCSRSRFAFRSLALQPRPVPGRRHAPVRSASAASSSCSIEAVAGAASKVKIGPGLDPTTELGPLAAGAARPGHRHLRDGLADGAAPTGGKRWGETGTSWSRPCWST